MARSHGTHGAALALLTALMALPAALPAQDPAAGDAGTVMDTTGSRLSLPEVLELARQRNPALRAASAAADAAAAREPSAGLPPDPTVQVGVMNLRLPELSANMAASMAPAIQAMQRLPFPGKLGLGRTMAAQTTEMARASALERWWEVRTEAAASFYAILEMDRKLMVNRETLGFLEDFRDVAQAAYAAGTGPQANVLRANVEVARTEAEGRRLEAMRAVAAARLNAVLDRPADTPVPAAATPALPSSWPDPSTLEAWAEESRPMLARSRAGVERAQTGQALARRQIWPDLSVGLQYGARDTGSGTAHMGGAMIGFSIPVFAGSRQLRLRDEAAAMEAAADAELTAVRAGVNARIGQLRAELDRARTLLELYRFDVLPQAEANVESSFAAYQAGTVDFATLVDAELAVNRYEQEYHTLLADYGRAVAELEMTVGRVLPVTTPLMAEEQ